MLEKRKDQYKKEVSRQLDKNNELKEAIENIMDGPQSKKVVAKMIRDETLKLCGHIDERGFLFVHFYTAKKGISVAKLTACMVPVLTCGILKQEIAPPKSLDCQLLEPFIVSPPMAQDVQLEDQFSEHGRSVSGVTNELRSLSQLGNDGFEPSNKDHSFISADRLQISTEHEQPAENRSQSRSKQSDEPVFFQAPV